MDTVIKHINDTNASYRKVGAGDAKNTDLFLDNAHFELFENCGEKITVRFNKLNLSQAILFIASILPRKLDNSTTHRVVNYSKEFVIEQLEILDALFRENDKPVDTITQNWNIRKDVIKKNGEKDSRFYFNGLIREIHFTDSAGKYVDARFTIRNYLAGGYSDIMISKAEDGIFDVSVSNVDTPYGDVEKQGSLVECFTKYRKFITAIKSKPFLLLAGISGTGKSRIVRELARACWDTYNEEYGAQKPRNFEMVQVKPNWHDSTELMGYVSRVSGREVFVVGDFLKFVARAWEEPEVPYFLCLDEMNLAPVEQYFAEYLSVIESRKLREDGSITTDPIIADTKGVQYEGLIDGMESDGWFNELIEKLTTSKDVRERFRRDGICLPQNLIVIGTVNMDETTYSFSRKVLDRAMTIEMNEFDLYGGLTTRHEEIGKLEKEELISAAVEGVDVYGENRTVCDIALNFLDSVNTILKGTPFSVAYRTRNELLLYVVNNLPYCKDDNGNELSENYVIARALDEITNMKILSRIEGDDTKVSDTLLSNLSNAIENGLTEITGEEKRVESISLAKIEEMRKRLSSGYTSFWS